MNLATQVNQIIYAIYYDLLKQWYMAPFEGDY